MLDSLVPPVALDDAGGELRVVVYQGVGVGDGLLQAAQQVFVDFLVGGQQQDLIAGVGEVAVDEVLAVAAVELAQGVSMTLGSRLPHDPHQAPQQ